MNFDMPNCGACRTCEIACSFHHTKEFRPSVSSLRILDKEVGPGKIVFLAEKDEGETWACDGCLGLNEPLCVEQCKEKEELDRIIREFLQRNSLKQPVSN
jgi:Fe-S-cluster-containing hydrogenase component 2